MNRFVAQLRRGWKQNGWQTTFLLTLLPTVFLAGLISLALPSSFQPFLMAAAVVGSLVWAGLKEGPRGRLGFPVWCVALGIAAVVMFAQVVCLPVRKHSVRFFVAGHGFSIEAIPDHIPHTRRAPRPMNYTQNTKWA